MLAKKKFRRAALIIMCEEEAEAGGRGERIGRSVLLCSMAARNVWVRGGWCEEEEEEEFIQNRIRAGGDS